MRGVVGKMAVAGTSGPSLRRRRSSLARRWVASVGGASGREGPDGDEGALDTMEGATESTEPQRVKLVSELGESGALMEALESLRSGGRWVGLRLRQVDSASRGTREVGVRGEGTAGGGSVNLEESEWQDVTYVGRGRRAREGHRLRVC